MASPGRRVRLRDTWHPVYDYGCGWQDCPECAAGVALEIQRAHEKMRDSTLLCMQLDTPEEAAQRRDVRGGGVRASRLTARAKLRVKRVLTPTQREQALAVLQAHAVPRGTPRAEWLSVVWLELEHPTITVASKKGKQSLGARITAAVNRAQDVIRRAKAGNDRLVSIENFTE